MRGKVAEKRERCTNVMSAKSYSARGIGPHTIFGSSILTRRPMKLNADIAKRNTVQRPISEHTYQRSTWRKRSISVMHAREDLPPRKTSMDIRGSIIMKINLLVKNVTGYLDIDCL